MHTAKSVRWRALQEKCKPLEEKLQFINGFCKVGFHPTGNSQKKTFSLWSREALQLAQDGAGWTQVSLRYLVTGLSSIIPCVLLTVVIMSRTGYVIFCMGHKTHAEHASLSLHPAPALSCPCSGRTKRCSSPRWAFFSCLHHGNCPEFQRNIRRHLLHANSCQINHCILQHNPWGGLYLWNLLLSLHFPIYLNHVIHSARRMNVTAWDFNPSLLRIWFSERERERAGNPEKKKL